MPRRRSKSHGYLLFIIATCVIIMLALFQELASHMLTVLFVLMIPAAYLIGKSIGRKQVIADKISVNSQYGKHTNITDYQETDAVSPYPTELTKVSIRPVNQPMRNSLINDPRSGARPL